MKNTSKKLFSVLIVAAIFFFLGRLLWDNWERVREYEFVFNYWYLGVSFVFFTLGSVLFGTSWHYILKCLEPGAGISRFQAFRVAIFARLGKYLPGTVWSFAGRVYLGAQYNVSKKALFVSSLFQPALAIISGIIFGVILVSLSFGIGREFYLLLAVAAIGIAVVLSPRLFYKLLNFALKKIGKEPISEDCYLTKKQLAGVYLYILPMQVINGGAMFFLIRSITEAPWAIFPSVVGMTILSNASGLIAVFAPGGLGVREGVLAALLKLYYPLSVAILITLIARIWLVVAEVVIVGIFYLFEKVRGIKY
jgi:uncharacterized membrane protein YbhN (UPF0104 family)